MIVIGANMAFEGIQDLWHVARGDLDVKSVNLIKEATGHTADSVVDLTELVVSARSAKAVKNSKTMNKVFSKASSELKSVMGKAKKVVSTVSDEAREISRAARQTTRKQLAKFRRPRRTVSRISLPNEIKSTQIPSKASPFKPDIQLFAEKVEPILKRIHGEERNIRVHVGKQNKHIPKQNNYENAVRQGKIPSIFYGTAEDAQELVDKFSGSGVMKTDCKERVNFGKVIGKYINREANEICETTWGIIHYSKNGTHIVPSNPNQFF